MWCAHCRSDVSAIVSADSSEVRCAVCDEITPGGSSRSRRDPNDVTSAASSPPKAELPMFEAMPLEEAGALPATTPSSLAIEDAALLRDDWDLNNDLQQARRFIELGSRDGDDDEGLLAAQCYRSARSADDRGSDPETNSVLRVRTLIDDLFAMFVWMVICTGAMVLTFGGGLLVCTIFFDRPDLWNWGLLTALAGQLALFLGCAGRRKLARWTANISDGATAPAAPARRKNAPFHYENPNVSPPWSQRTEAALAASLDAGPQPSMNPTTSR